MRLTARHAQRGQTLPFWVMGILVALTLTFFVSNYANTVKYQIRAQNAADSAAAAALGKDAGALNSTQTLLAAFDIQQVRVKDVAAALPFVLGTAPCGATNLLTSTCTTALQGAATDLTASVANLQNVGTAITNFQSSVGNQLTDTLSNPQATVNALFAPNGANGCAVNVLTDCDFTYTTTVKYNSVTGLPTVDEYACKKVTNTAAVFMHLPTATYYTIGHATTTLAPMAAAYSPSQIGSVFQSSANVFPDISGSLLTESLAGLNISSALYATTAAPPAGTAGQPTFQPQSVSSVCPA